MWQALNAYRSSFILLAALLLGALLGRWAPEVALAVKPLGQIFLNLLFMIIVPLVAVSVTASIAKMTDLKRLGKILVAVMLVSIAMAAIPAVIMTSAALSFNPAQGMTLSLPAAPSNASGNMDFVSLFTTSDFAGLLSKSNILALIVMSVIAGIAIGQSGTDGQRISRVLDSLNVVILKIVNIIMTIAPIGLAAYFAATMASQDGELLQTYANAILLFFVVCIGYFVLGSSLYAWLGGGKAGVVKFWQHAIAPTMTALATSSSLATLPVTMRAALNMGLKTELAEICLPLLVNLNKGGAALITSLKIVFIYSLLGLEFGPDVFAMTIFIAVLSAFIIGGVPGGAYLGEIFIVTTLGLPLEAIPILVVLGTVTDAASTVINVIHDLTATQIIERVLGRSPTVSAEDSQS